jgi:hypothetical protein
MATPSIVPRADLEGGIGTAAKRWGEVHAGSLEVTGAVSAGGKLTAGSLEVTGAVSAGGKLTAGSLEVTGAVSAGGKLTAGSLEVTGAVSAGGKTLQQVVIGMTPTYYKRPSLMTSDKTTLTIPANTQINIGGKGYYTVADVTLQTSALGTAATRAGKDVYVYACQPTNVESTEPVFVLSMNSTVPTGYTANNSRKIGGFHCLCVATGTISGNAASGYAAGDIIPNSVWDLLFRADSENEGMAYDENACIWVDIYLPSWDGAQMRSVYGGVILDGYSAMPMHGERFVEYAGKVKKFLLSRDQFLTIAETSNQKTNINGSADPNTTGGHVDTAGRRMVSAGFIEDLTGALWQWTSDIFGAFNNTSSTAWANQGGIDKTVQTATVEGNHYLDYYQWQEDGRGTANINVDGTQHLYGDAYGALVRALVGGDWVNGSHCGSRSVILNHLSSLRPSSISARCGSRPRVVNL